MTTIVTCSCGAKVRVPEHSTAPALRCPKCHAGISTAIADATADFGSSHSGSGVLCPTCQTNIMPGERQLICPACQQVHHKECWDEIGGCAIYGCTKAPALEKENASQAQQPLSAWGDTKKCPVCAESIKSIAIKCRYCGTDFDTVDPLNVTDLKEKLVKAGTQRSLQVTSIVLFGLSVLGCAAPVLLVVTPIWLFPRRKEIIKAGPIYVVMGYGALILSLLYSLLMLLFLVFHGVRYGFG